MTTTRPFWRVDCMMGAQGLPAPNFGLEAGLHAVNGPTIVEGGSGEEIGGGPAQPRSCGVASLEHWMDLNA